MSDPQLLYLYGLVPADAPAPPDALRGVDGTALRVLPLDGFAAVLSALPAAHYGAAELDARLEDLQWVGERALAHERVLNWFVDHSVVLPLRPFSLHAGEERLRARLDAAAPRVRERLAGLRGRRQWGVQLWQTGEVRAHLAELSPALRELAGERDAAPPGRRFLLDKKHRALEEQELAAAARRVAAELFAELAAHAERATPLALPASGEAERKLALHAVFLVPDAGYDAFQRAVSEAAHGRGAQGFALEFTGPWPPYHFASLDD